MAVETKNLKSRLIRESGITQVNIDASIRVTTPMSLAVSIHMVQRQNVWIIYSALRTDSTAIVGHHKTLELIPPFAPLDSAR